MASRGMAALLTASVATVLVLFARRAVQRARAILLALEARVREQERHLSKLEWSLAAGRKAPQTTNLAVRLVGGEASAAQPGSMDTDPCADRSAALPNRTPSLFSWLPQEALLRVLDALPPVAQIECERVSHEWRDAVGMLDLWPAWANRAAALTETHLVIPGVMPCPFGAPPAAVPPAVTEAAEQAKANVAALDGRRMLLASCSGSWTVLSMRTGASSPSALAQHHCHDLILACCPSGEVLCSGDRDGQLRLWRARTGEMIARVAVSGSVSALELCGGAERLLVGDSQGTLSLLQMSALARGEARGCSWRAHDGKASALSARWLSDRFVSGGADGIVRAWSLSRVEEQGAACARAGAKDGAQAPKLGSSRGHDLGLCALSDAVTVARHVDTVTHVAIDDAFVVSGSRDGVVLVSSLVQGETYLRLPGCGHLNCLAVHRSKLLVCGDDGQQATLHVWDLTRRARVQQIGGMRKWSAPTNISYFGHDCAIWLRDSTLCQMTWPEPADPAAP